MRMIGITGGVGSGKSQVLSWLREHCQGEFLEAVCSHQFDQSIHLNPCLHLFLLVKLIHRLHKVAV